MGTSELTWRSGEVSEGCLLNGPNSPHNVLLSVVRVKRKVTISVICSNKNMYKSQMCLRAAAWLSIYPHADSRNQTLVRS